MIKDLNEKKLFKGIGTVLLYFFLSIVYQIPFIFLIEKKNFSEPLAILIVYILLAITFVAIYHKDLKKDLKDFKKNYKKILLTTLKYWLIGFVIMIVCNNLIALLPIKGVENQASNESMFKQAPMIEAIMVILFAPLVEEIVYRLSFKRFTSYKWLFTIVTGLIFAFVHVMTSIGSVRDLIMLIYLIPYGALGCAFGYAYFKNDNIYGTMVFHSLHNLISILELILIGGILK